MIPKVFELKILVDKKKEEDRLAEDQLNKRLKEKILNEIPIQIKNHCKDLIQKGYFIFDTVYRFNQDYLNTLLEIDSEYEFYTHFYKYKGYPTNRSFLVIKERREEAIKGIKKEYPNNYSYCIIF